MMSCSLADYHSHGLCVAAVVKDINCGAYVLLALMQRACEQRVRKRGF